MTVQRTCPPPTPFSDLAPGDLVSYQTDCMRAECTGVVERIKPTMLGPALHIREAWKPLHEFGSYVRLITSAAEIQKAEEEKRQMEKRKQTTSKPRTPAQVAALAKAGKKGQEAKRSSDEDNQLRIQFVTSVTDYINQNGGPIPLAVDAVMSCLPSFTSLGKPTEATYRYWRKRWKLPRPDGSKPRGGMTAEENGLRVEFVKEVTKCISVHGCPTGEAVTQILTMEPRFAALGQPTERTYYHWRKKYGLPLPQPGVAKMPTPAAEPPQPEAMETAGTACPDTAPDDLPAKALYTAAKLALAKAKTEKIAQSRAVRIILAEEETFERFGGPPLLADVLIRMDELIGEEDEEDEEAGQDKPPAMCRICGCTHIDPCSDPETGETCHWAEPDLCSVCAAALDQLIAGADRPPPGVEEKANEVGPATQAAARLRNTLATFLADLDECINTMEIAEQMLALLEDR